MFFLHWRKQYYGYRILKLWICFLQTLHSFSLHRTILDGLEWHGLLVDFCYVFISCLDSHTDGTHSLQKIHCWASDEMLNFSKSFNVGVNYSFILYTRGSQSLNNINVYLFKEPWPELRTIALHVNLSKHICLGPDVGRDLALLLNSEIFDFTWLWKVCSCSFFYACPFGIDLNMWLNISG